MLEEFLKDDKKKLFFLQSVMLGIEYGQNKNSNNYKEIIEKEIMELSYVDTGRNNGISYENSSQNNGIIYEDKDRIITTFQEQNKINSEIVKESIKNTEKIITSINQPDDKNTSQEKDNHPLINSKKKIIDMIDKLKKENPIQNQKKIILLQKNLKVIDNQINKIKI
jgi:hypothetical protein